MAASFVSLFRINVPENRRPAIPGDDAIWRLLAFCPTLSLKLVDGADQHREVSLNRLRAEHETHLAAALRVDKLDDGVALPIKDAVAECDLIRKYDHTLHLKFLELLLIAALAWLGRRGKGGEA